MAAGRIDPEMYEWCERMETPNLAQEYAIELSLLPNVQELNANPLLQQQQNAAAAAPRGVDRPRNFADDRNVGFCTDPKQGSCNGIVRMVDRGNKGTTYRCGSCKSERTHFHGRQFISNSAVNNGTFFTRFDIIDCPRPSIGIQQLLNIMWTWAVDITMDKAMKLVDH
jgi:hypothetical protein